MFRNLKAIEIAEGALLADVAIILQMLARYMPVGYNFFRMLIFVVFTLLVLRRGVYVGVMAMTVALFLCVLLMGPQTLIVFFFVASGGLFLGVTMKHRWRHGPLLLLGITGGSLVFYCTFFLIIFLSGTPIDLIVRSLQRSYDLLVPVLGTVAGRVGLRLWWQQSGYPTLSAVAKWGFSYWWLSLYMGLWLFFCPMVTAVYTATNFFVRVMGYNVRPFPGGRTGKWLYRGGRRLLRWGIKMGLRRREEVGA